MKRTRVKRNKRGFSLVELLCSMAIMILVGSVAMGCLHLGVNAFTRLVRASEARILCSTLSTSVNEELRFARSVSVSGGETIYTDSRGRVSRYEQDADGRVLLRTAPVLSERSYPLGLQASVTLSYDAPNALVTALVRVTHGGEELTQKSFSVVPVNIR